MSVAREHLEDIKDLLVFMFPGPSLYFILSLLLSIVYDVFITSRSLLMY